MNSRPRWRTSGRSGNTANCVELAHLAGQVGVRDSKPSAERLTFDHSAFTAFLRSR